MIVGIHQPQYWPWLPYLLKIAESDVFVILDSVAFQKNGLQNRNRIKTSQGAQWLTVPVRQKLGQSLQEVEIDPTSSWRRKHWDALLQNYGKASAFSDYSKELEQLYAAPWTRLAELNIRTLELLLRWLKIDTRLMRSSEMTASGKGSDLILALCREAGASTYISGVGGKDYLDEASFAKAGIQLVYRPPLLPRPYPQQHPKAGFIADLSALDILLNCGTRWSDHLEKAIA